MNRYDIVVVGAGLYGAVFANIAKRNGKKVLVIDKREHIGGNCATEHTNGIHVHRYGAHIFHTNDRAIWDYVNCHASFNNYRHTVKAIANERVFSFPVNLLTLSQLWGAKTPSEGREMLERKRIRDNVDLNTLEGWALSQVGQEIYDLFIRGYTHKQWNRDPRDLPASIIRRIPIRDTFNDSYFDDKFQGIPTNGYTEMFHSLLDGVDVELCVDYLKHRQNFDANLTVYTGPIDAYFDYALGRLDYRSVRFETETVDSENYQGAAVVNYNDLSVPWTRIIEHKNFNPENANVMQQKYTVISREYSQEYQEGLEPFYPVGDKRNQTLYNHYELMGAKVQNVIFGGRLGTYRYYDMHQVIAQSMTKAKQLGMHL